MKKPPMNNNRVAVLARRVETGGVNTMDISFRPDDED